MRILFIISLILFTACAVFAQHDDWHTKPDKWEEVRFYHTPFEERFASRILLEDSPLQPVPGEKQFSPNKAYWFSVSAPDYTGQPPWNTVILIHNEREDLIKITLLDHNNSEITLTWINEKLLQISVWWGAIVGTDFIFDVEKEDIVYKEMVRDGQIAYQQWHQPRVENNVSHPLADREE